MKFYFNKQHLLHTIPYPERLQKEGLVKNAAHIFLILFGFLMVFKPFIVSEAEQKASYLFTCLVHAAVPSVLFWMYYRILNRIRKRHQAFPWNLFKEYSHLAFFLLLTGLVNFAVRDLIYTNSGNRSWHYLFEEIRNTLVAGIFFYFLLRLAGFYLESKKESPMIFRFVPLTPPSKEAVEEEMLFISTQVRQDDFYLNTRHLLFVKSDGNYIELTQSDGVRTTTEIKRIPLSQFASLLSEHPQFFRCHRTYLVNLFKVTKVAGNSQGYQLSFGETGTKVPVSRKQKEAFDSLYEKLSHDPAAGLADRHKD